MSTTTIAKSKFISGSPRKLRLIANAVKHLTIESALVNLKSMSGTTSRPIFKTITQAVANATHNQRLDPKNLILKNILVDAGRTRKKIDKSHGSRFDRGIIHKRSAHITVILEANIKPETNKKDEKIS